MRVNNVKSRCCFFVGKSTIESDNLIKSLICRLCVKTRRKTIKKNQTNKQINDLPPQNTKSFGQFFHCDGIEKNAFAQFQRQLFMQINKYTLEVALVHARTYTYNSNICLYYEANHNGAS